MSIFAVKAGRLAVALALGAGLAAASPTFTVLFDPGANLSAADKTIIQNAVDFYTSNMTGNFSVSIVFGSQSGGGATSEKLVYGAESYNSFYNDLVANSSGDATDLAAIASLGVNNGNNPVTGSASIQVTTTLASALGLDAQQGTTWGDCGGVSADACITLSTDILNTSGTPNAELNSDVQHEIDEVLGTSSALPNGGGALPTNPDPADLFRYGAPGIRSFAFNTSTSFPCTGTPTAYLSVNGGVTNLDNYNNCNNGGDYGDWFCDDGSQVQCFAGPLGAVASLSLGSPEVALLDAVGFNFVTSAVPEPTSAVLLMMGLAAMAVPWRRSKK
jgi:hypothetical protein